jgi:2-polyprenyl-3-methyl-5-hydroxy-6-metoxy-1,4-benzoquinol methylase
LILGLGNSGKKMSVNKTECDLCEEVETTLVYEGAIRDGVHGSLTEKPIRVVRCTGCGLVRLETNPLSIEYYQSDDYRNAYNETSDVNEYIRVHDREQSPRLEHIGVDAFRDKVVLDYGCGGGVFLDLVFGVAKKTVGIEPFSDYHDSLRSRGHEVYSSSQEALSELECSVDTIVSFGVIEHVESPSSYLNDALSLLCTDGRMFIETDNLDDILLKVGIEEFPAFFYRTAHLWYFDATTLEKIAKKAGFSDVEISYRHNFDLSNIITWAAKGGPTGCAKLGIFNSAVNCAWTSFIEQNGFADLVCTEMRKS